MTELEDKSVNLIIFNQDKNTDDIQYNKERGDRKLANTIKYERLLDDKQDLERDLKQCKNK